MPERYTLAGQGRPQEQGATVAARRGRLSSIYTIADERSQIYTIADERSQIYTIADERSQIYTIADERSQIYTIADERSQIYTIADERSQLWPGTRTIGRFCTINRPTANYGPIPSHGASYGRPRSTIYVWAKTGSYTTGHGPRQGATLRATGQDRELHYGPRAKTGWRTSQLLL